MSVVVVNALVVSVNNDGCAEDGVQLFAEPQADSLWGCTQDGIFGGIGAQEDGVGCMCACQSGKEQ